MSEITSYEKIRKRYNTLKSLGYTQKEIAKQMKISDRMLRYILAKKVKREKTYEKHFKKIKKIKPEFKTEKKTKRKLYAVFYLYKEYVYFRITSKDYVKNEIERIRFNKRNIKQILEAIYDYNSRFEMKDYIAEAAENEVRVKSKLYL